MPKKNIFNKKVPFPLYKKIISLVPICCVDAVFKAGVKVFLFKRTYEPAKNEWWFVGGRVLKNESFRNAVLRKVKEEVGVEVDILRMIGVYETFFDRSRFDTKKRKVSTHSINVCFVVEPKDKEFKFRLNEEYGSYRTITEIDKNFHPYIKKVLRDSGLNLG